MLPGPGLCSASGPRAAAAEGVHPRGLHVGARRTHQVLMLPMTLVVQRGGDPLARAFSSLLLPRVAHPKLLFNLSGQTA